MERDQKGVSSFKCVTLVKINPLSHFDSLSLFSDYYTLLKWYKRFCTVNLLRENVRQANKEERERKRERVMERVGVHPHSSIIIGKDSMTPTLSL